MTEGKSNLRQYDWTFAGADSREGVHSIHPYPAKFIPQIPRRLIEIYGNPESDVVFDPFCGSGTALVESMKHGHDCMGVDVNPLSCLISRVKSRPLPPNFGNRARDIVTKVRNRSLEEANVPDIPNVNHWFKRPIQETLALIVSEIERISEIEVKEALQVALSSIIVQVSNQDSNTRYAAVENDVTPEDVLQKFSRSVSNIESAFLKDSGWRENGTSCTVINDDILEIQPNDFPRKADVVVTSPPYPNVYEYWLYHKYRMYWLGMSDPTDVREREIGARPHYHGSDPQDEDDFERQMESLFSLLKGMTTSNTIASFIVGSSVIQGREIDNGKILERAASEGGFAKIDSASRTIPSDSKSFNPGYSKDRGEEILTFEKK